MKTIAQIKDQNFGFISMEDLPDIIHENRLQLILVRCGCGRFLTPAQNVAHFVSIIEKEGSDYIRDLCFPAS